MPEEHRMRGSRVVGDVQRKGHMSGWSPPWRTRDELLRFADLTLAEFFRQFARYGDSRIAEQDGLLLFAGAHSHPNPYRNGAFRLDTRLDAETALARAGEFFGERNRSFVFWVGEGNDELDALCRDRGFEPVEPDGLPEMVLEGPPAPVPELPAGTLLRRTDDPAVRNDYVDVIAEGWGMEGIPTDLASAIFFHPDSAGDPHSIAFVAYVDDRPASGCMALLSNGVAVGGQGATAGWARRRGLAEACYAACLEVAYNDFGIRGSVCQSSPSGQRVWQRMGYRKFTRYMRYVIRPGGSGGGGI
jgi:hypothetical protein